jgi:hypothetical protein
MEPQIEDFWQHSDQWVHMLIFLKSNEPVFSGLKNTDFHVLGGRIG